MQLYSIASGSSGNCIYIGEEESGILVDAGISMKQIREGLESIHTNIENIKGIFITHEHSDHIKGLGPLLRKFKIPVYATADTIGAIWEKGNMKNISPEIFHSIDRQQDLSVGDYIIESMPISHDAADPVCYTVEKDEKKIGIATDMGKYDDALIEKLGQCDAVLLEANHDINMLQVGPYPYSLKMRILGEKGHLSNDASARLIKEIIHPGMQHVVLGHLSKENNFPELAYKTVQYELESSETWNQTNAELYVANRFEPTQPLLIK